MTTVGLLLAWSVAANAEQRGWYGGAAVGFSQLSPDTDGSGFSLEDRGDFAFSLTLGRDLTRRFSAELSFTQLGSAKLSGGETIGYQALSVGALAYLLGDVQDISERIGLAAYTRLGFSRMDNSADINLEEANATALWLGFGVERSLSPRWAVRGELASYDGDAQAVLLGLVYRPSAGRSIAAPVRLPQTAPEPRQPTAESVPRPEPAPRIDPLPVPQKQQKPQPESDLSDCTPPGQQEPMDNRGCALFAGVQRGIEFTQGAAQLTEIAERLVDRLAQALSQYPGLIIEIGAHTATLDSEAAARELSRQRALSVARRLVSNGIPVSQLRARAFGSSQPRADNTTPGGRRLNNRIEMNVIDR